MTEIGSFVGQEYELGTSVLRIFTPDYQILFFQPVKYPGGIGRALSGQGAYFALDPAPLPVQVFKEMEMFPGEIEGFQQAVNIGADGL
ncbi:MAG: hypothetical protein P8X86_02475 [Desulfofustis sp.]